MPSLNFKMNKHIKFWNLKENNYVFIIWQWNAVFPCYALFLKLQNKIKIITRDLCLKKLCFRLKKAQNSQNIVNFAKINAVFINGLW